VISRKPSATCSLATIVAGVRPATMSQKAHASGASGAGLFNAAVEAQKEAIGVDSDQYLTASPEQQPLILTSMIKRVDVAVYNAIQAQGEGTFGGSQVFGMAEDGVDYATSNPTELTADITEQLDQFKQQIIDGTIVVPDTPEGA